MIVPINDSALKPYLPPGGIPLMTGTLETTSSTSAKQKHYLLDEVETKLNDLDADEDYEMKKTKLFIWCTLSSAAGTMLVMYALGLTVVFASTKPSGVPMIASLAIGVCCMTPCCVWFKYVWLPNKRTREFRREMHRKRRDRVDEAARVIKENLRIAHVEDAKRAKAAAALLQEDEELANTNKGGK